mmetsp:Transcript_55017/g.133636  ORF Transcript_55017/g.133636 Transcript_55017/m.133636 type:complete len:136 (+) Transcript_55017:356-763(+)
MVEQVPSWEPAVIEHAPAFEVPDNVGDGAVLGLAGQVPSFEVLDKNVDDDDDGLVGVPRVTPSEVLGMNFGDDADLAGEEQVLMLEVPDKSAAADVVHYCTLVESFVAVRLERVPSSVQRGAELGLALAPTRDHH